MSEGRPDEGLRARKRAATMAALEKTALELAAEHGYDNITVETICDVCMVSPRTFFNYFGSKEGAILGPTPPEPSVEARERFIHSGDPDVLTGLVETIIAAMSDQDPDPDVLRLRRQVITRHPDLMTKQIARVSEQEAKLTELVMDRFVASGRTVAETPDLRREARMVVALVGGVMRYTVHEWFDNPDSRLNSRDVLHDAVRLIHRITRVPDRLP